MKFVDGKAVFPVKTITIQNTEDVDRVKELGLDVDTNGQISIYSQVEVDYVVSKLTSINVSYSLTEYIKSESELKAENIAFSSRGEIMKFLNENIKPTQSRQELETELKSVKDALFKLMFGEMS